MTKQGMLIDEQRAGLWSIHLQEKAEELGKVLSEGLGGINLDSPIQLMKLLYDDMGLPEQYIIDRKRGKRRTANAEALNKLAELAPENKILMGIVDRRHLLKMNSTFIEPAMEKGRVHARFGVAKAATGRFNSWDPNAQNVPEYMRDIWIPDNKDCVLLSADWSQIEWRLAMVMAGDPVGLELLTAGVDNHSAIAAEVLGKKIGPNPDGTCDHVDCKEHVTSVERYQSKFIVYGLGYGRGADSVAKATGMRIEDVHAFIGRFFTRFRRFAEWREENVRFVKQNYYLANPFKRRRWWYSWAITEVYNFPQQSTAADMMYEALVMLKRELPKGADLRLTVHDEVVLNVPKDLIKLTRDAVRRCMEATQQLIVDASARPDVVEQFYPDGWSCPADIHIGENWKMCKSKDPADKLRRKELEKHFGLAA